MSLVDQIKDAGVVGAGGAGFPAHVKMAANVEWLLANGAECEPLMHKDRELMTHFSEEIISGLKLSAESVSADKMAIGVKSKNKEAIRVLRDKAGSDVQIHEFGDYYPAGDEYEIVATIINRLMPPGGIPLDVGAVVSNVESLYNIYQASQGKPVTTKFITIAGMVKEPVTLQVPVGITFEDALELAGGATISPYAVMEGGLMMGKYVENLKMPVTKCTGGLIVLPQDHHIIKRYTKPSKEMHRIGHSACDQCSYCTELCPRYLLGYDIQPHLVMRSLGFTMAGDDLWNQYAMLCCHCGLCSLYACPEELYPREACERSIDHMRDQGVTKWQGPSEVQMHPMKDARRVPTKMLMNRLGVTKYEAHAGYKEFDHVPERVFIPLSQHIGAPSEPVVKKDEQVSGGQCIADIPEGKLGARVHASIAGRVREITEELIVIEA